MSLSEPVENKPAGTPPVISTPNTSASAPTDNPVIASNDASIHATDDSIRRASQGSGDEATRVTTNATCSEQGTSPADSKARHQKPTLGPLLRMEPLTIYDLPTPPLWSKSKPDSDSGPSEASPYWKDQSTGSRPGLVDFVQEVLLEGHRFIKHTGDFKVLGETMSKPAIGKVQKTHLAVSESDLGNIDWANSLAPSRKSYKPKKEDWYGRRSEHTATLNDGTATWIEFQDGLLHNHSEREAEYDPSIYDARLILDWATQIRDRAANFDQRFSALSMRIFEMCHKIPGGSPRHFSALVISGKIHPSVFVTVQIPVDLRTDVPEAFYSIGRNVKEGSTAEKKKKTVEGQYVSIESCVHKPADGKIYWDMTTCSDAKGALPLFVQKLALPGQLAKDVGFFMEWARKKNPRPSTSRIRSDSTSGKPASLRQG